MITLFYILLALTLLLVGGITLGRRSLKNLDDSSRLGELLNLEGSSLGKSEVENISNIRTSNSEDFSFYGFSEKSLKYLFLGTISLVSSALYFFNLSGDSTLSIPFFLITNFVGLYIGFVIFLFAKKWHSQSIDRRILFQTPLVLESLILLVESGLGILPAIEKVISGTRSEKRNIPVEYLDKIYNLSLRGLPFSEAVELIADTTENKVLRHTLLHLDASQSGGGELVPALKSLANHSHSEWKLDSEARVKRLENLVVFPVFVSVIGLMLLSASVPLVPVFEFNRSLADPSNIKPYLKESHVK